MTVSSGMLGILIAAFVVIAVATIVVFLLLAIFGRRVNRKACAYIGVGLLLVMIVLLSLLSGEPIKPVPQ